MDSGNEVTLDEGFRQLQIPLVNQRFVRHIVNVIGIDSLCRHPPTFVRCGPRKDRICESPMAGPTASYLVMRRAVRLAMPQRLIPARIAQAMVCSASGIQKTRFVTAAEHQASKQACPSARSVGYALLGDGTCENCSA